MLKLRLKKYGRKGQISYRIVVMRSITKRDGRAVEELGFYNPGTKEVSINIERAKLRMHQGVKPTATVSRLLEKALDTSEIG